MKSLFSRVPEEARNALAAAGALMLVLGSFMTMSGDLDINAPFGLAAAVASITGNPSLIMTKNVNSPSGTIIPGRSQVLGVFDMTQRNLTYYANLQRITANVQVNSAQLNATSFMLNYSYCVSAGDIYSYGYRYGYSGTFCQSYSAMPVSSVRVGNVYSVTFVPNFAVMPGQTLSTLSLSGITYYSAGAHTSTQNAQVRVKLNRDTVAQTTQCKTIHYGYHNLYSYASCRQVGLTASVGSAIGNWLSVLRNYGYGYGYAYPMYPIDFVPAATGPAASSSDSIIGSTGSTTTTVTTTSSKTRLRTRAL